MQAICEDRTVVITGAGGGLGRAHALEFARHGARVIVNDIRLDAAQKVVDEIHQAGGAAQAEDFDITDYAACAEAVGRVVALYGSLDVVVNNAGINRDRMFATMDESDWDVIMAVHLKGHFCLSSHAVRHWRDCAKAGQSLSARIINTTSGAGLNGSIGQSNYAAAKAGIVALTLNQAAELGRYGITANAIAPAARTAMTSRVPSMAELMAAPDDDSFDYWAAANVSPLVVWLGSERSSAVSGRVFEAEGGKISMADGWRSTSGVDKGARWEAEEIDTAMQTLLEQEIPAQKVYGS
jgi:NAD(P)-dependent dehydrogenase (short-subunit alcohol dehydrogenase family)